MRGLYPIYVGEVKESAELRRILALPRRLDPPVGYEELTGVFKAPGGEMTLRHVQAQALAELHLLGGLLAPIRVGAGKTLITFLASQMLPEVERPLLLVPAKLKAKTRHDFAELGKHWRQGPTISVISYELIGRAGGEGLIDHEAPDLIVADEVHHLKNIKAAVTKRVGRYMDAHPETHFVGLSGTMTKRSLFDFAHLAEWALGQGAPVPLQWRELEEWDRALAEESVYTEWNHIGALRQLFEGDNGAWYAEVAVYGGRRAAIRKTYNDRLVATPGVVSTTETTVDASLVIQPWLEIFEPGEAVKQALDSLYELWVTPDGIPLEAPVDVWRHARELALGFYYRWNPPPPRDWLEARKAWSAFVRMKLGRRASLDSAAQVAKAFEDTPVYQVWAEVKDSYEPNVEPVWLDDTALKWAVVWAREEGGIVWVEHRAVGEKLEELGLPYYGNLGLRDGEPIESAQGGIAASIAANKEGRNLQHYHKNLVLTPPTTGSTWEQMLGRTHRDGQKADEVTVEVFTGCMESLRAFWQAVSDARYQQGVVGGEQKLLAATITLPKIG